MVSDKLGAIQAFGVVLLLLVACWDRAEDIEDATAFWHMVDLTPLSRASYLKRSGTKACQIRYTHAYVVRS
jgi:hypothetical protein